MQKFQKVRFFEKINDSEHFGEEPVLSKKTTKTTKKKQQQQQQNIYIYMCVYIYVAIGEKQRHSTFIPKSLFFDCSLIRGFYSFIFYLVNKQSRNSRVRMKV